LDKEKLKQLRMNNANLFYYKMDPEFKEDLDKLIHSHSSIFAEKNLVPPIHNSKGDITGYMMQKNEQSFAALAEIFYKYAVNNDINGIKHFSVIQVQEAAKLGTQGSIHRIYERDKEMAKALAMSNAVTLRTPEMKDDLRIYKSNYIVTNHKKRRIFKPPNNRRLDWRSPTSDSSSFQSGFAAGQGSNPLFFLNGGESIGPILSPKGTPGHPPSQILSSEGRQVRKEDLYQVLFGYDIMPNYTNYNKAMKFFKKRNAIENI
jgi:hypothetical protein